MKQSDDNDKDSGAPRQDGPPEGGTGRPDDVEGPLAAGSPRNLLPIAMTVLLLMFAGIVFYIAAVFADSEGTRDNWSIATTILTYLSYAVFYPGVLVGLGTFATAWSGDRVSAAAGVARFSWAGAALVVLGVARPSAWSASVTGRGAARPARSPSSWPTGSSKGASWRGWRSSACAGPGEDSAFGRPIDTGDAGGHNVCLAKQNGWMSMELTPDVDSAYMSSPQAARILGITGVGVAQLVRQGKIPAVKIANRWLIPRSFVEEFARTYEGKRGRPRRKGPPGESPVAAAADLAARGGPAEEAAVALSQPVDLAPAETVRVEESEGSAASGVAQPAAAAAATGDAAPAEMMPAEAAPIEAAPVEAGAADAAPAREVRADVAPAEVAPAEVAPAEAAPVEVAPGREAAGVSEVDGEEREGGAGFRVARRGLPPGPELRL